MKAKIKGVPVEGDVKDIIQIIKELGNNGDENGNGKEKKKAPEKIVVVQEKNPKRKYRNAKKFDYDKVYKDVVAVLRKAEKPKGISGLITEAGCLTHSKPLMDFIADKFKKEDWIESIGNKRLKYKRRGNRSRTYHKGDYHKFLSSRIKYLMNSPSKHNYETAQRMAREEWNNNKVKKKDIKIPDFPKFNSLTDGGEKFLIDIAGNVIANQTLMTYPNEGNILGIENIAQWGFFCAEFLKRSGQVSEYFCVPNKFKETKIGTHVAIKYGD